MVRQAIFGGWRGVVGAFAIYAVLLQLMLAGMAGPALSAASGDPSICAPSSGASGDPAKAPAQHAGHLCCLVACAPALPPLPPAAGAVVSWPARTAIRIAWVPADEQLTTGPPRSATRARGPPRD